MLRDVFRRRRSIEQCEEDRTDADSHRFDAGNICTARLPVRPPRISFHAVCRCDVAEGQPHYCSGDDTVSHDAIRHASSREIYGLSSLERPVIFFELRRRLPVRFIFAFRRAAQPLMIRLPQAFCFCALCCAGECAMRRRSKKSASLFAISSLRYLLRLCGERGRICCRRPVARVAASDQRDVRAVEGEMMLQAHTRERFASAAAR